MDSDYHYRYDNNGNIAKIASSIPTTTYDTSPVSPDNIVIQFDYEVK